jgi:hypothetical protein
MFVQISAQVQDMLPSPPPLLQEDEDAEEETEPARGAVEPSPGSERIAESPLGEKVQTEERDEGSKEEEEQQQAFRIPTMTQCTQECTEESQYAAAAGAFSMAMEQQYAVLVRASDNQVIVLCN